MPSAATRAASTAELCVPLWPYVARWHRLAFIRFHFPRRWRDRAGVALSTIGVATGRRRSTLDQRSRHPDLHPEVSLGIADSRVPPGFVAQLLFPFRRQGAADRSL